MTVSNTGAAPMPTASQGRDPAAADLYLFGPVVVTIRQHPGVWQLTPHGQTLGDGMAKAQHALIGREAIEIGAGTGIHAIAALKLGVQTLDITDIDSAAIQAAADNAARNAVAYRHSWIRDWLDFEVPQPYDLVLCNPPFCKAGTADRRCFVKRLIQQSPRFLRRGGYLLFVQSSMANFALSEQELREAGFYFTAIHEARYLFRGYYFEEPGFIEESRRIAGGFEEIDGSYVETLRVYLCTKR